MSKTIIIICVLLLVVALCVPIFTHDISPANECPPYIMVDGKLYRAEFKKADIIPTEDQIAGHITSCVDGSEMPKKDDQSNFPACLDQPYVLIDGALYLYYSGQWNKCTDT